MAHPLKQALENPEDARIIASGAAGITDKVGNQVRIEIMRLLENSPNRAKLKSVRFVPSTSVPLQGKAGFEVLANTTIELVGTGTKTLPNRLEVIESVVKINKTGNNQKLANVSITGFPETMPSTITN